MASRTLKNSRYFFTALIPCILSGGFIAILQGEEKSTDDPLLEEVIRSPNPGNLALLGSRAAVPLTDLEKKVEELKGIKSGEVRRKVLEKWRLVVNHEKLLKDVEGSFLSRLKQMYPRGGVRPILRDSRYYRVMSISLEERTKLAETHMDAIHVKYREVFKFREKLDEKFALIILRSQAEYGEFTGNPLSAAMYVPSHRALICHVPRNLKDFDTFYHEGLHQFISYYYPNVPPWLNEGLAEYFEEAKLRIKSGVGAGRNFDFVLGGIAKDQHYLMKRTFNGGSGPALSELMQMNLPQFYNMERVYTLGGGQIPIDGRSIHYAAAWSFVHYLIHAGGGKYRKYMLGYLKDLRDGKYPSEINRGFFQKLDEYKLTLAWKKYVLSLDR